MVISEERKFIFVHVQKTGGISVQQTLYDNVPDAKHMSPKHQSAAQAAKTLDFDAYYSFAFVRNPWARLVSWHSMIMEAARTDTRRFRRNPLWQYASHYPDFGEFVRHCVEPAVEVEVKGGGRYSFATNQLDYLTSDSCEDQRIVSDVGYLESFASDLTRILSRIGVEAEIRHENRSKSNGASYRDYYTPETREIVAERFAKDIEHFGYSF